MVETETFASLALIAQLLSLIFKTLYSNKEISPRELISYLDAVVKGLEKSWISEGDLDPDVIASQVLRLAAEVGQLASARHTINVNGVDHTMYINYGTIIPLLVLAAALGALGYVYMWWKGLSVSDLMYVTKSNMENAISILTKHLEHVSEALAATKRHLTQRIENLDGKLDDLLKILKLIKTEVTGVRGDLSQIGYNFDALKRIFSGVDEKICSLADKQDLANRGVLYLCNFFNRGEEEMPEVLQEQLKLSGKSRGCLTASGTSSLKEQLKLSGKSRGCLTASGTSSLKGLKEIADWLETGNASRSITDCFLPRLY